MLPPLYQSASLCIFIMLLITSSRIRSKDCGGWFLAAVGCINKHLFVRFFTKSHVPKWQQHLLYYCSFIMLHIFVYHSLNLYFYYSLNCCQKALLTRHTACVYYVPVLSLCPSVFACMCTENSCMSCRTRNTFIIKYCLTS